MKTINQLKNSMRTNNKYYLKLKYHEQKKKRKIYLGAWKKTQLVCLVLDNNVKPYLSGVRLDKQNVPFNTRSLEQMF